MSKLSLFDYDDDRPTIHHQSSLKRGSGGCGGGGLRSIERKRRRRCGSRSVSGRSSDGRCLGSNNSKRGGGVYSVNGAASAAGASYVMCSDFPVAIGTDSSGELFGDANWSSDVSEATKTTSSTRRDKDEKELACFRIIKGMNQAMGVNRGIGLMLNLGTMMTRKRMILGCSFGVRELEVVILTWKWLAKTISQNKNLTTEADARSMIVQC